MENYSTTSKSAIGLDANVAAALGYIVVILGLINFLIDKENKFVRFHGIQSVIYAVGVCVVFFVLGIVLFILSIVATMVADVLALLVGILNILLFLAFVLTLFGGLIYCAYKAYQGQTFKLPVVGDFAEKLVNS